MSKVILSIGSNLGDRTKNLLSAASLIDQNIGTIIKCSSVYETEPWGFNTDDQFLNQVLMIDTNDNPSEVMNKIIIIEESSGRIREASSYHSRNIDIDILFFDDMIISENNLQIPHPRLHLRNFTMIPLAEIAADFMHPVLGEKLIALAKKCEDRKKVVIFNEHPCIQFSDK